MSMEIGSWVRQLWQSRCLLAEGEACDSSSNWTVPEEMAVDQGGVTAPQIQCCVLTEVARVAVNCKCMSRSPVPAGVARCEQLGAWGDCNNDKHSVRQVTTC